jgi:5'-3' exonuclease
MKAIVDLSSIYWRHWHRSESEDMSSAKRKTLGTVEKLRQQHPGELVIAIDSPPYERVEMSPDYKSQRGEKSAASVEELKHTIDELKRWGLPVVSAPGWEADDVIATYARSSGECVIYGSDKDLLQIGPIVDPFDGKSKTAEERFGVKPAQIPDLLALMGDASDNIEGVRGIGEKTAAAMLAKYAGVREIYYHLDNFPESTAFKPSTRAALLEYRVQVALALSLAKLRDDLQLTIEQSEPETEAEFIEEQAEIDHEGQTEAKSVSIVREAIEYRQALEPYDYSQCKKFSEDAAKSHLYNDKFANKEQMLLTIMRGRELGMSAVLALDNIDMIKGKPSLPAATQIGLVMSSGKSEYIYCVESSDHTCTWATKRKGFPEETRRTMTFEECRKSGFTEGYNKKGQWVQKDNWNKQQKTMLKWRCASLICREVYPDIIRGLYDPEELQ